MSSLDALVETDAAGNNPTEYVFFSGKRIARRDPNGSVFYFFADHLGSSRVVTNATGVVVQESDYYPFGGERIVVNNDPNPYKFTSKERDTETGLDYFLARYYGSGIGRFHSSDPENASGWLHGDDPQGWNAYAYARNNPLALIDPTGKTYCEVVTDKKGNQSIGKCVPDEEYRKDCEKYKGWIQVNKDQKVEVRASVEKEFLPFLAVGTTLAVADGPLPVGDAIGGTIVAAGALVVYFSANRDNAKKVAGLIETAWEHLQNLQTHSPQDPNRDHWKKEARAALERAKQLAKRLPRKAREEALQIIRSIEGALRVE